MYKLVTDQCHAAMWRWGFAGSSVLVGNGKFVVSRKVSVKSVVIVNIIDLIIVLFTVFIQDSVDYADLKTTT